MNNKGALTALVTIPIAIVFIILALSFAPVIKQMVDDVRGQNTTLGGQDTGLNCDEQIRGGQNASVIATCTATDLFTPVFFGVLIGLAGVVIGAKIVFGQ